jgi:hypothetical protein
MYYIHTASLWSKSAASDYTAPKLPFATVAFGLNERPLDAAQTAGSTTKGESTVRYHGIEVNDALEMAEQTEV